MTSPRSAVRRLLAFLSRRRIERELDGEIHAHLELLEHEALARGESPGQARLTARRAFGAVQPMKEAHRDHSRARWLDALARDARYGLRSLRGAPLFTACAVLILGVSIGANTTMFSAVRAILLDPLEYRNPDELVVVLHDGRSPVAPANYFDWAGQNQSFAQMGAAEYWTPNVGIGDRAERTIGLRTTSSLLALLGVAPLHGRLFDASEDAPGSDRRVVLSYGLWQRRFSGDPKVVGQSMRLDGEPYTIVGVMPREFAFAPFWAVGAELWAPLPLTARRDSRGGNSLRIFARLAPGVTVERAQADITAITTRLEQAYPGTNRRVQVVPLKERVVGDTRLVLTVFLIAVGFVLLIACANVAHMLLARATAREREVAVRLALGATRFQIVRQFLLESLQLAVLSGLAGVGLAVAGVRLLTALAPANLPRVEGIGIDGGALAFTIALSVLTGLVFGSMPAWQAARPAPGHALRSGRGALGSPGQARLRDLLVASELALALVLLIGAGLMIRSMAALQNIDPGFEPRGVLSLVVSVKGSAQEPSARRAEFFRRATERLRALPGVQGVGAINHLPIDGDLWTRSFEIGGRPPVKPEDRPQAVYRVVLPGYFEAMRLPIVRGRDVAPQDDERAPRVVLVNERLVRSHFSGQDPIGERIAIKRGPDGPEWMTIVGVVKDAVQYTWNAAPDPEIYLPYPQSGSDATGPETWSTYLTYVLRVANEPAALAASARSAIWSLDGAVSVSDVITMEAAVDQALAGPRFQLTLLAVFAGVALMLAAAGIYSVMSYAVARRTQEIGLRLTLGAQRGDVLRLVLRQALARVAIGAAVGLAGALALTRLMSQLLYGVEPTDPLTFTAVSLVLIGAALLASYLPARQASRVDPMTALRAE